MAEMMATALAALAQGMTAIELGGAKLLLVREGDDVRALEGTCPHAKAPLEKGALCDGRIICPWHMGAFDARTGALLEPVAMRSLHRHAVRIAGGDVLVDTDPLPAPEPASHGDDRLFVLAGTGAASAMAAVTLRDSGYAGRLMLVGPDAAEPLDRTQLSKMAIASPEFDRTTLPLLDAAATASLALEREVARVTAIDPARRCMTLSTGLVLDYDAALLATGAAPVRPDLPGAGLPHVCLLRTLADVDAILENVRPGGHAVVIGSSFIGMEAASALTDRKMHVTVVGSEALPFVKQFGPRVAAAIKRLHESKGVRFCLEAKVERIDLAAIHLAGAPSLPADLVVVGVGVRPVLDYAPGLERSEDGGVTTDAGLRVMDGLWAAGDIASPAGWPRIEHWRLAQQHGRVAALGMMGIAAEYEGVPFFWSAQHGKRLQYLGHAGSWDEVAYDGDVESFDFIAWYVAGGTVAAALVCGRDRAAATLSHIMRQPIGLAEARVAIG